jgi:hypothetical protein
MYVTPNYIMEWHEYEYEWHIRNGMAGAGCE